MRTVTLGWLESAYSDLIVIEEIIDNEYVTHMVAFHSQQLIEKSLKAILEFNSKTVPKKHDLLLLKDLTNEYLNIAEEDILEDLNELYIESRYPNCFGLLPHGKPTKDEAIRFYSFANTLFDRICVLLNISIDDIKAI